MVEEASQLRVLSLRDGSFSFRRAKLQKPAAMLQLAEGVIAAGGYLKRVHSLAKQPSRVCLLLSEGSTPQFLEGMLLARRGFSLAACDH